MRPFPTHAMNADSSLPDPALPESSLPKATRPPEAAQYLEAITELHAATLAAVQHLGEPDVMDAVEEYWMRILSRYHNLPMFWLQLEMHLKTIRLRAEQQTVELRRGPYAERFEQLRNAS